MLQKFVIFIYLFRSRKKRQAPAPPKPPVPAIQEVKTPDASLSLAVSPGVSANNSPALSARSN